MADGKLGAAETTAIKARTDNVSYAVLAGTYLPTFPTLACNSVYFIALIHFRIQILLLERNHVLPGTWFRFITRSDLNFFFSTEVLLVKVYFSCLKFEDMLNQAELNTGFCLMVVEYLDQDVRLTA